MSELLVTVKIPTGTICRDERPCVFLKFCKARGAHNCALYGRLLKGGEKTPRKCADCIAYEAEYFGEQPK